MHMIKDGNMYMIKDENMLIHVNKDDYVHVNKIWIPSSIPITIDIKKIKGHGYSHCDNSRNNIKSTTEWKNVRWPSN